MASKRGEKRRRTRSHNSLSPSPHKGFFIPGSAADGGGGGGGAQCSLGSLTELMEPSSNGVKNMILAHEIAVDKNFRLEKSAAKDSSLESAVKEIVHEAFWDLLDAQLNREDPPVYQQALSVFQEIREMILSLLILPQHANVKESITEKLDLQLIEQQTRNSALNMEEYADYILGLMGKFCAPVRDEEIAELREIKSIVPLFRGIIKTLENMKLDLANCTLEMARPLITSQSIEYEREKFKEFLTTQKDGLKYTREWFQRHPSLSQNGSSSSSSQKKELVTSVMDDAFLDVLEWDEYYFLPETLVMDQKRIWSLRDMTERTSVSTAIILVSFGYLSSHVIPADGQKLKETWKKNVDILLADFYTDEDLLQLLPNISEQVLKDTNEYLVSKEREVLSEDVVKSLKSQIAEIEDPNQRVRDLVQKRVLEFCKAVISNTPSRIQVPPGLTICQRDLFQIATGFRQLISYNKAVFKDIYSDLIENHVLFKPDN